MTLDDVASDDETAGALAVELVRERGDTIVGGDGACDDGGGSATACAFSTTELRDARGDTSATIGDSARGVTAADASELRRLCVGVGGSTGFVLGGGGGCCDDSVGLPTIGNGGTAVALDGGSLCFSPLPLPSLVPLGVVASLLDSVSSSAGASGGGSTRFELDARDSIGEFVAECASDVDEPVVAAAVVVVVVVVVVVGVVGGAGSAGFSISMNCCASAADAAA
jgi:hypothetical protein